MFSSGVSAVLGIFLCSVFQLSLYDLEPYSLVLKGRRKICPKLHEFETRFITCQRSPMTLSRASVFEQILNDTIYPMG